MVRRLEAGAAAVATLAAAAALAMGIDNVRTTWEDDMIASYESWHGEVDDATRDLLIHGTALACGLLREDPDLPRTWDRLVDYGFSSDQATSVISGAVVYRCTEFAPLIQR